jgi:hypothetical protein
MVDESVNFKQAIVQLRGQIEESGRPAKELDKVIRDIDVPLWSITLDVNLLEKISDAVDKTGKKSEQEFDRLLEDI